MAFNQDSTATDLDPIRVEGDRLTVDRALVVRESGIIATLRITPHDELPVKFQIIDPLPAVFDVEELGFHPDFEPDHGRIEDHQVIIAGLLDTTEPKVVKYGLCPARSRPPDEVASAQANNPPSIELSDVVDPSSRDDVDFETPAIARGDTASEGLYSSFKRSVFGPEIDRPASTDSPAPEEGKTEAERAAEAVSDAITDLEASADDPDFASEPESVEDLFNQAEAWNLTDEAGGSEPSTTDHDPAEGQAGTSHSGTSVVEQLISELRHTEASQTERRALAEELNTLLETEDRSLPRSTSVRLERVESRMEEFSAYTDALRELIDEHGTASEFVTAINDDLGALESAIDALEDDLDATTDDLADIEAEQSALSTDVDTLEETIESVADEASAERHNIENRLEDLTDAVETLETEAANARDALSDDLAALESDVAAIQEDLIALREDVEEGKARRRAIAKALSGEPLDLED